MNIVKFAPLASAGSALAFIDVETPAGMVIRDMKLMRGPNGEHWVATPSIKETDRDGNPIMNDRGRPRYREFIAFRNRQTRDRFSGAVIEAVRAAHPEVLR